MTNLTTKQLHTSGLKEFWDVYEPILLSDILPQDNIVPIVEQVLCFYVFQIFSGRIQLSRKLDIKIIVI